ncbi:Hypothetical protein ETEE_p1055 (plasmid) [Edwardsiella anguillarum ET080813]|uniref:Uncharacterized protein n=1 Tax=Edwardsiella anguillarum ET080813 TaxID=667120 RepID=A0A076LRQ0_9GAMM|nr:Hypothetical protein ETEE_p1055 [Edwardsiella anguillarum ET080813]
MGELHGSELKHMGELHGYAIFKEFCGKKMLLLWIKGSEI